MWAALSDDGRVLGGKLLGCLGGPLTDNLVPYLAVGLAGRRISGPGWAELGWTRNDSLLRETKLSVIIMSTARVGLGLS